MSTLYFDPNGITKFSSEISNLFADLKTNFEKIGTNMNTIANGKWKGTAAKKNLDSLDKAQTDLANFINGFSNALMEATREAANKMSQLEATNLGDSINVKIEDAQKVDVAKLQQVDVSVINYDYAEITSIASDLNSIYTTIEGYKDSIPNKIRSYIGENGTAWGGNAADEFQSTVISAFNKIDTVYQSLKTCIDNIKEAAANAANADK